VITGLEPPPSVRSFKDKAFARTVNRDDVYRGATSSASISTPTSPSSSPPSPEVAPEIGLART
jgi:hypothetical protein